MLLTSLLIFLPSCGSDDEDEPNIPDSSLAGIVGVWKAPKYSNTSYDYLNLKTGNIFAGYDFYSNNTKYEKENGYYYYDSKTDLMIIHYYFNEDCDVYKVVNLTESDLVMCWVDDVSDRYDSNYFDESIDLAIIRQIDKEGYSLDTDDYEFYERSSESELNSILKNMTEDSH